jgi:4-amino-4-deoxy-L-arabinose transferase-like glycosyltransferase
VSGPAIKSAIKFSLALAAGLHVAFLAAAGLSVDEAHYALYAAHLDWSYFDHPPLVGWLQWPALVLGGRDWEMRSMPFALWGLTMALLWRLTESLAERGAEEESPPREAAAGVAILLFLAGPLFHVLGIALLPDSLLLPLTAWVMLLVWKLRDEAQAGRWTNWLLLGLAVGLAGLSKYTGIFLALSAGAVLLRSHGSGLLRRPGPWLAVAVALVMASPVLIWNANHGWISFRYQLHHAAGDPSIGGLKEFLGIHDPSPATTRWDNAFHPGHAASAAATPTHADNDAPSAAAGPSLLGDAAAGSAHRGSGVPAAFDLGEATFRRFHYFSRPLGFAVVQGLAYGPLLLLGLLLAARRRVAGCSFCLAFGLPPLLVFALFSILHQTLPHWAGFAWLALLPLAAAGLVGAADQGSGGRGRRRTHVYTHPLVLAFGAGQAALCLAGFVLALTGSPFLSARRINPFADLYGWDRAGAAARQFARANAVPSLAVANWTLASRLAWYARPLPVHDLSGRFDQFALWYGGLPKGASAIFVNWSQMDYEPPIGAGRGPGFGALRPLGQLTVARLGGELSRFDFDLGQAWQPGLVPVRRP